jgi:hypothetical protein
MIMVLSIIIKVFQTLYYPLYLTDFNFFHQYFSKYVRENNLNDEFSISLHFLDETINVPSLFNLYCIYSTCNALLSMRN